LRVIAAMVLPQPAESDDPTVLSVILKVPGSNLNPKPVELHAPW